MKVCQKCQKAMGNNDKYCSRCGNSNGMDLSIIDILSLYVKKNKKIVVTIILCVIATLSFGSIVLNIYSETKINAKIDEVKEQLAYNEFRYNKNQYGSKYNSYKFDGDAKCQECDKYVFKYNVEDVPDYIEKEIDYEIVFEDDMVFLEISYLTLEVQYDKYGQIDCLYDIKHKDRYERVHY